MKSAPTFNTLALGSLNARKKQYRALTAGIALAIFFMSSMLLMGQSIYFTYQEQYWRQVGRQDAVLMNAEDIAPKTLLDSGYVRAVGNLYVIGATEGGETSIGYYDEEGAALANRQAVDGRLPEAAGEIALEQSKLQRLRSKARVGDRLTLSIRVPDGKGYLPGTVQKTYVLVGILAEQTGYQQPGANEGLDAYTDMPGAMVSPAERIEAGGRPVVHRLVAYAPGVTVKAFGEYALKVHDQTEYYGMSLFSDTEGGMLLMAVYLCGILVLAASVGIVNAFSAALSERRQEIGMMRAVGATRRQIRSVFGREALLIALITAPAAIALSHIAVWGISLALNGAFQFHAVAWFLPVELAFSLAVVTLAAFLPLMEASRVSPMQAVREVSLLRAKKRLRLKERPAFNPPRLLARRHRTLYRTKQAGAAAMVALSLTLLPEAWYMIQPALARSEPGPDFSMYMWAADTDGLVETNALRPLFTDGDVQEAAQLPLVMRADATKAVQVNLLMDRVTDYLIQTGGSFDYGYLLKEPPSIGMDPITWRAKRSRYLKLRGAEGIDKDMVTAALGACSEETVQHLKPYVLSGRIDIRALNEGREVLVVAPEKYYITYDRDADGKNSGWSLTDDPRPGERYDEVFSNDMFFAGDQLSLCRLFSPGEDGYGSPEYHYAAIRREDKTVRIGAVLSGDAGNAFNWSSWFHWYQAGPAITTLNGLAALGFQNVGYRDMNVTLSATPDEAAEESLTAALSGIANRVENMEFTNELALQRENRKTSNAIVACCVAAMGLFFSICVSMVNNAVTNRIRSDKRAIGTLRAVGAPLEAIVSTYWLQVATMLGQGAAVGILAIGAILAFAGYHGFLIDGMIAPLAILATLFIALLVVVCGANLRLRIREVVSSSIVDNIREL
jgi:cell division protein FtsX